MKFTRDRRISGVEILPKAIAPEDEPWVSDYVSRIVESIVKVLPADFHSHGVEDKKIEVGNVIYPDLNGRFREGQILTIVDRIFERLSATQK